MSFRKAAVLLGLGLLLAASPALAFSGGIAQGGTSCSGCHGAASSSVTPIILGSPTLLPSQTGTYTASIAGTQVGAGLDVATTAGSLTATDAGTGLTSGEVTHTQRNNGVFSYSFDVTAPAVMGPFDLLVAMLDYNEDFGTSGDLWNTGSLRITVVPEPGTLLLIGGGLLGLATVGRRRRAAA